jgi:hypothetical protein
MSNPLMVGPTGSELGDESELKRIYLEIGDGKIGDFRSDNLLISQSPLPKCGSGFTPIL